MDANQREPWRNLEPFLGADVPRNEVVLLSEVKAMCATLASDLDAVTAERGALQKQVERLKTVPMKYRRMEFNAQLQNQLAAKEKECERLRVALREIAAWTDRYTAPGHPISTTARRALSASGREGE